MTARPTKSGLGWVVNLDKGHFTGRNALLAEKARPARRRLTKMVVDGNKPVGEAFIYAGKNGKQVGEVKCTTWSPILKANLAIADIELHQRQTARDTVGALRLSARTEMAYRLG